MPRLPLPQHTDLPAIERERREPRQRCLAIAQVELLGQVGGGAQARRDDLGKQVVLAGEVAL